MNMSGTCINSLHYAIAHTKKVHCYFFLLFMHISSENDIQKLKTHNIGISSTPSSSYFPHHNVE